MNKKLLCWLPLVAMVLLGGVAAAEADVDASTLLDQGVVSSTMTPYGEEILVNNMTVNSTLADGPIMLINCAGAVVGNDTWGMASTAPLTLLPYDELNTTSVESLTAGTWYGCDNYSDRAKSFCYWMRVTPETNLSGVILSSVSADNNTATLSNLSLAPEDGSVKLSVTNEGENTSSGEANGLGFDYLRVYNTTQKEDEPPLVNCPLNSSAEGNNFFILLPPEVGSDFSICLTDDS